MRILRHWLSLGCLVLILAILPGTIQAQETATFTERPTAVEVAAGMVPCLQASSSWTVHVIADTMYARLYEGPMGHTMTVSRLLEGEQAWRIGGQQVWLDDDPIQPPLVLQFELSQSEYPDAVRQVASTCFSEAHHRQR